MRKLALALAVLLVPSLLVPASLARASSATSGASASDFPSSEWRTARITWTNPAAHTPRIVDLRFAQHRRFDRVVIDVTGKLPGGRTAYRRHFEYDASGEPVPIRAGLELVLKPAFTIDSDGIDVYDGPRRARPGFPTLKAVALTGSFEGVVSFAFGLSPRRAPYRVFVLHQPQRIVVDFKHS